MKPRLLIADDDASVRESLKRVLIEADYEADAVADGQMVLDRLVGERCDLLILDLELPICSGWKVLDRLKHSHPALPIVAISGLSNVRATVIADRCAVFMEKPIEAPALLNIIGRLLAKASQENFAGSF